MLQNVETGTVFKKLHAEQNFMGTRRLRFYRSFGS